MRALVVWCAVLGCGDNRNDAPIEPIDAWVKPIDAPWPWPYSACRVGSDCARNYPDLPYCCLYCGISGACTASFCAA